MQQTTPIISGRMNAVRSPVSFNNLGHGNVIFTSQPNRYADLSWDEEQLTKNGKHVLVT
jgi:hypothetical protein